MKKRTLSIVIALVLFVALSVAVKAASWNYYVDISLTDTSNTNRTNLVAFPSINNTALLSGNYFGSSELNSNVQTSGADSPYGIRGSYLPLFVSSLGARESKSYRYFLGYSPAQTSLNYMFGSGGYASTPDAASLEPGANDFILEWRGYFDAAKSGSLLEKTGAYGLDSTTGTVRAYTVGATSVGDLLPTGAGYLTGGYTLIGCAAEWDCINDPVGAPDDGATYMESNGANPTSGYALSNGIIPAGQYIESVQVKFRAQDTGGGGAVLSVGVRLGGVNVMQDVGVGGINWSNSSTGSLARPGGGDWTPADFDPLEVVVFAKTPVGSTQITQVYVEVTYGPLAAVTAAVTSGVRGIKGTSTAGTLELLVDSGSGYVSQATVATGAVQNNTNAIILGENGPVVYSTLARVSINGANVALYQPATMTSSSTLPDNTANSNNANITWGSNPASVNMAVGVVNVANVPFWQSVTSSTTANYITDTPIDTSAYNPVAGSGMLFDIWNGTAKTYLDYLTSIGGSPVMDSHAWWLLLFGIAGWLAGVWFFRKIVPHGIISTTIDDLVLIFPLVMGLIDAYLFIALVFAQIGLFMMFREWA